MTNAPFAAGLRQLRQLTGAQQAMALLTVLLTFLALYWVVWLEPLLPLWRQARAQAAQAQETLAQRRAWQTLLARPSLRADIAGLGCELQDLRPLASSLDLGILLGQVESGRALGAWQEAEAAVMLTGSFHDLSAFVRHLQVRRPVARLYVRALVRSQARRIELHGTLRCLQAPEEAIAP